MLSWIRLLCPTPNFSYANDPTARVGVVAPNANHFATLRPYKSRSTGKDGPLTEDVLQSLIDDRVRLYVHGHVSYADILKNAATNTDAPTDHRKGGATGLLMPHLSDLGSALRPTSRPIVS